MVMVSAFLRHLLLPLLVLLPCLLLSTATSSGTTVLDTDGKPVLRGVPYYVLTPMVNNEGNLGFSSLNWSCPLHVVLQTSPADGPPILLFSNRHPEDKTIPVGEDTNIMFAVPTRCTESTQWMLNNRVVTTGGHVSPISISHSRFRIVPYRPMPGTNFYQFVFCFKTAIVCSDLGETGGRQLGLATMPLAVTFKKMSEGSDEGSAALMHPTA